MPSDSEYKPQNEIRGQGRTGAADASLFVNAESGVDATREDREAVKSESTGRIPQSKPLPPCSMKASLLTEWCYAEEIDDLLTNAGDQTTKNRTRGIKNDAMRQEREVDEAIDNMPEDRI